MLDAEEHKRKTANNRSRSATILTEKNVDYSAHNNGAHLVVHAKKGLIDFWPGTGKWIGRTCSCSGRGVFNLLRLCT